MAVCKGRDSRWLAMLGALVLGAIPLATAATAGLPDWEPPVLVAEDVDLGSADLQVAREGSVLAV